MKLNRSEYERLSDERKRQYLNNLSPREVSELFSTPLESAALSSETGTLSELGDRLAVLEQQVASLIESVSGISVEGDARMTHPETESDARPSTCKIIEVASSPLESNNVWSKHEWKLRLKNTSPEQVIVAATIQYHDEDSYVLDEITESNLELGPNEDKIFTGFTLIEASVAPRVALVHASVKH